ncbi:hypothetical protein PspLS_06648 [Pyricularia sp. CBS 133598]|nr:hypothetical protein PspLS_06648 [Pyricularia sp. CBS 133598]
MFVLSWLELYENNAGSLDGGRHHRRGRAEMSGRWEGQFRQGKVVDGIGTAPENWTNAASWLRFAGFRVGGMNDRSKCRNYGSVIKWTDVVHVCPVAHCGKSRLDSIHTAQERKRQDTGRRERERETEKKKES